MFRTWLVQDNVTHTKSPNRWEYVFSVMYSNINASPRLQVNALGNIWRGLHEKETKGMLSIWRCSSLVESVRQLMTIPCWRDRQNFGYMDDWTGHGMHRVSQRTLIVSWSLNWLQLYSEVIRIHIVQLEQLVHPLDITAVTEERLKLSFGIRLRNPPTWPSLEKEGKRNKTYTLDALQRAKTVPADFHSILQPEGCQDWVFDSSHVSAVCNAFPKTNLSITVSSP
jgi:hypothetical protein